MIVIDYLTLIGGANRYAGNRQQEVSEISRSLKTLALELHVPILCLAQLSRTPELREDKRPILSDLRESGSIEQDADIVLFLHSDEYGKYDGNINRKIKLIVAKHRAGQTGAVDLIFKMNTGSFDNYINKEDENE